MSFGFGFGLPRAPLRGRPLVAAIRSLFAANEPGVWYDPSDLSTLFQDAAGTTPVTAVEQPVGLMLDKSKGLVLGPELVTNGDFSNGTTGWGFIGASSLVVVSGVGRLTTDGSGSYPQINQYLPTLADGVPLRVAGTISNNNTGRAFRVVIFNLTDNITQFDSGVSVTNGAFSCVWSAGAAVGKSYRLILIATGTASAGLTADFDNISVRELPGNHASQPTATSRPVLSARVNLLTKTEQFDDSYWTKTDGTVSANAAVAPDGTLTADKWVEGANLGNHFISRSFSFTATAHTLSIRARAGGRNFIWVRANHSTSVFSGAIFDLTTGGTSSVVNCTASSKPLGNGWFECSITFTPTTTASGFVYAYVRSSANTATYTGDGTSGIYIWGADLRVANDGANLPPYQRVNTATDYDTVGFPHYLRFDGVDDWLVTPTITPGTDKVQVFAGVRKLSDAAIGCVAELSANFNNAAGSFMLAAPFQVGVPNLTFLSRGSTSAGVAFTGAYSSPVSAVMGGYASVSEDISRLRVNGVQAAQSTTDQGSGNYGNHPLYIGRRGGTTLPFNGHLYSLIVRFGSNLPAATVVNTEKYINTKTRAY